MAYVSENSNHGVNYLNKHDRKYNHLRYLLIECWEVANTPMDKRMSTPGIDVTFKYSIDALTSYIRVNFTAETINRAHARVCSRIDNRKKGRPQGALNKKTVMDTAVPSVPASDSVMDEVMSDIAPSKPDTSNDSASEPTGEQLDSSKFVLKTEYARDLTAIDGRITAINNKVEHQRDENASFYGLVTDKLIKFEDELNKRRVVTVEFKPVNRPTIDLGRQHFVFPDLLALCCAAIEDANEPLNVWLYGPAGTGKTTAAKNIANALTKAYSRPFQFRALSKLSTEYQVLGYQDAAGKYVPTHFREVYEHGGVIILDEIDSWSPNAMTALNGALANGYCAFPDRMVDRHPDCVIIAGANTVGSGGNIEYVGRLKQDAASLDRFEMIEWPIDEALEAALTNNDEWLKRVRRVRANVAAKGIKDVMITPRAAIKGAARIRAGISMEMAEKLFLKRGMTAAQWDMVK